MNENRLFEGIYNFRDMGGIVTKDGRRVKKGLLFRSGQLSTATTADVILLKQLQLRTIIVMQWKCYKIQTLSLKV